MITIRVSSKSSTAMILLFFGEDAIYLLVFILLLFSLV